MSAQTHPADLGIRLVRNADLNRVARYLRSIDAASLRLGGRVTQESIDRLRFASALPDHVARRVVESRLRDDEVVRKVAGRGVRGHVAREG